ncbi:uncharacterized protein [Nicotiana sylvestris]|uniref:uncharacterized protein n=1 Tax=Nicotiana sylvestris TaxID=4096 RepID=UPI00388CD5DC
MELIPITSHRIEKIAESSCASQKSRKNLEINQKVEFTAVRSCSKRYELKCIVDKCGWNICLLVLRSCSISSCQKYRGVLFVVVSKDANNQIFPLCFGVADSENNEAYIWFFGEMRKAIQVRRELVFLSDRNQSIANGIRKVFPEAHHGICLYHFEKNLKQRHAKATLINLFQSAARSYKREDFNQLMSQLKSIDKKTYHYIMEEPPERWARSWFPRRRYDRLTTNMVESMNSVLLKGREMHILRMLDFTQEKLEEWFYERRKKANETFHRVSIWAEEEMTKKMDLACKMFVFNLDSMLFRINSEGIEFIVDLKKRTCDCVEFQLDELPCPHAIAAINKRYLQKSDYCSNWYSRETRLKTYEGHVNTVGDQKSWEIPQNVQSEITKPPDVEILQGRRQKKRHIPTTESSVPFKSTKCS